MFIINLAVLVAVGDNYDRKSEKFEADNWSDIQEPPVPGIDMFHFAALFHTGNHYYFGGHSAGRLASILRLDGNSWTWSNVGQLNSPRWGHGVILVGNTFKILGGDGTFRNEVCLLTNEQLTCTEQTSSLTDYVYTPVLSLVDDNYGNC